MMFDNIKNKHLEKKFEKKLKDINKRLQKTRTLLFSKRMPKNYTVKELRNKSKGNLITILFIRYRHLINYKETVFKLRYDMKLILREYRKCFIENFQLRKCKNKKGMKRKLGVKSFKTRIIIR